MTKNVAMIDYGALLKINGEFVNKDKDIFTKENDTGYKLEKAFDLRSKQEIQIAGNYFIYAGNERMLLCFYKTYFLVISQGNILKWCANYGNSFDKETVYLDGLPAIHIQRLTSEYERDDSELDNTYKEYLLGSYGNRIGTLKWLRRVKKIGKQRREKRGYGKGYKRNRYKASWNHDGNEYEVIYGYGIDPSENVWNEIKQAYGFNGEEIKIIDEWFKSEE